MTAAQQTSATVEQLLALLTDKQRVFVESYLVCWNATEAALLAGYSPDSAHSIGWENLRKPEIRKLIDLRLAEHRMSADEVLARLSFMASGSLADFIDESGYIDVLKAREAGKLGLLKKMKVTHKRSGLETVITKTEIELHDPQTALTWLGKHHGLFVERIDATSNGQQLQQPTVNINFVPARKVEDS